MLQDELDQALLRQTSEPDRCDPHLGNDLIVDDDVFEVVGHEQVQSLLEGDGADLGVLFEDQPVGDRRNGNFFDSGLSQEFWSAGGGGHHDLVMEFDVDRYGVDFFAHTTACAGSQLAGAEGGRGLGDSRVGEKEE